MAQQLPDDSILTQEEIDFLLEPENWLSVRRKRIKKLEKKLKITIITDNKKETKILKKKLKDEKSELDRFKDMDANAEIKYK